MPVEEAGIVGTPLAQCHQRRQLVFSPPSPGLRKGFFLIYSISISLLCFCGDGPHVGHLERLDDGLDCMAVLLSGLGERRRKQQGGPDTEAGRFIS